MKFKHIRLSKIFKSSIFTLIFLWSLSVCLLICLCMSPYRSIENAKAKKIIIDEAYFLDTHDTRGARIKLVIISNDVTYYCWYPQSRYLDFDKQVTNDILSGDVTNVTAKISSTRTIRDFLLGQYRIVDLRSDDAIYYDSEIEKIELKNNRVGLVVFCCFLIVFNVFLTLIIFLGRGILTFKRCVFK